MKFSKYHKSFLLIISLIIICGAFVYYTKQKQDSQTSKSSIDKNQDCTYFGSTQPFTVTFPSNNSVLNRGSSYNIIWTGRAYCYDVGFFLNAEEENPYNFIGKAYQSTPGNFSLQWNIPANIQPGSYIIQFSGYNTPRVGIYANEPMARSASFLIQ